jgi:hypothetical protein
MTWGIAFQIFIRLHMLTNHVNPAHVHESDKIVSHVFMTDLMNSFTGNILYFAGD